MNKVISKVLLIALTLSLATNWLSAQNNQWASYLTTMKADACNLLKGRSYESKYFTRDTPAEKITIDLKGYKKVLLSTCGGDDGSGWDHTIWANAYFTKADGSRVWISDVDYDVKFITGGWWTVDTNLDRAPIIIAGKPYKKGILAHADSDIIIDVKKYGFIQFDAEIGIVNSSTEGSAKFRVSPINDSDQFDKFKKKYPDKVNDFLKLLGETPFHMWLTTEGDQFEDITIKRLIDASDNKSTLEAKYQQIKRISDTGERLAAYIKFQDDLFRLNRLSAKVKLVNIDAIELAVKDMNIAKATTLFQELKKLYGNGFDGIYEMNSADFDRAEKFLSLQRTILLMNPLLDKIIVTRYNLGDRAHTAWATDLGEAPWNYCSQQSSPKRGYDADLIELSNIQSGTPSIRTIYKAEGGEILSNTQLHWDGDRLMFTSANEHDQLQTYEIYVDGNNFKQLIVADEEDCDLEFFDGTYLPDGRIIAASNIGYQGVPCVSGYDHVGNFVIYDPKDGSLRRLQFDQESSWNPTVRSNGTVMFTHWEYTDLMHYYSRMVFTMNPDGTEQRALYGSGSLFPNSIFDMQELPGNKNRFIAIIAGHHDPARSGRLVIFDPTKSRKEEKGMIQEIPYKDRPIIPEVKDYLVSGVWPQFNKPYPLDDNYFLVSAKISEEGLWGIYLVDVFDNMTLIIENEGQGFIRPIDIKKRPMPAVIPDRIDLGEKEASVFIQDIYEGEGLQGVPRGTIKQLRVFAYDYVYLNTLSDHVAQGVQAGWDIKRLLGYVPIEADGSVIFKVPANTPFAMQPVDSLGRAVQWMRSWTVGMPGETISCVGCHEDRSTLPRPRRSIASTKKPHAIKPIDTGVRLINFEHDIQPMLDRACIACHNSEKIAGGRDYTQGRVDSVKYQGGYLYYSKSYLDFHPYFYRQGPEAEMAVLNPYEYSSYNSDMVKMLRAGHHGVELTEDEWSKIYNWLDFNTPYHNDMKHKPYTTATGKEVDQYVRRIELHNKYGNGMAADWKKEVEEYADYLKSQGEIEPVMPKASTEVAKEYTVKGFPFNEKTAQKMQGSESTRRVNLAPGVDMIFRLIPAGEYVMGNNKPMSAKQEIVKIDKPFWMGEIEVSNEQMRAVIPEHNSRYIGQFWKDHTTPGYNVDGDELSATKISYDLAMEFCKKLSQKSGFNIQLPTQEQWEWAARAGSGGDHWYGDANTDFSKYENLADFQLTKMAVRGVDPQPIDSNDDWYRMLNYIPKIESVDDGNMLMTKGGSYSANAWGLYDMQGNVTEWTRSISPDYPQEYIVCGGSWYDRPYRATFSIRNSFLPWIKVWNSGFRVIIED